LVAAWLLIPKENQQHGGRFPDFVADPAGVGD
jgi:hypothetical protein